MLTHFQNVKRVAITLTKLLFLTNLLPKVNTYAKSSVSLSLTEYMHVRHTWFKIPK